MAIYKLIPSLKDYLWGGTKLKKYRETSLDLVAESWELSFHENGYSYVNLEGRIIPINKIVTNEDLGDNCLEFPFFPILIKLIDAKDNLSVQVHPSDDFALENEKSFGKTEMWYVLSSEEGSGLYVGFKENENETKVKKYLEDGSILKHLNFFKVKEGDCYFIPSGTIHAIGKGVTIIEIQQNSNLTYRLFDYNRVDKTGNKRELHIEKALKVIDYQKYSRVNFEGDLLGKCKYFASYKKDAAIDTDIYEKDSFVSITFLSGEGEINSLSYKKFDSFFISSKQRCSIKGNGIYILTKVEKDG